MRYWNSKRRQGERRVDTDSAEVLSRTLLIDPRISSEDRRKSYGRRHDDLGTCNKTTCQCGEWNPTTKRYEVIS